MKNYRICMWLMTLTVILPGFSIAQTTVGFCGNTQNDLYKLLKQQKYIVRTFTDPASAVSEMPGHSALFIVANGYPATPTRVNKQWLETAGRKGMRMFLEYPSFVPGLDMNVKPLPTRLERGVVTSGLFGPALPPMSLLGINDCHILPVQVKDPLIVLGKVAGFDKAEYGIADIPTYPVLFTRDNLMVATTGLSNYATARYGPRQSWKLVWEYILSWMTDVKNVQINDLVTYVEPMYSEDAPLPASAKKESVRKGVEWFYKGRFFVHPKWKHLLLKYQGDGGAPVGPPVGRNQPNGDGKLGILEGHSSSINYDGTEQYRYWMRADVQGEVAFALAASGNLLKNRAYYSVANNLGDYIFKYSNFRSGAKSNPDSAVYGLIGWSQTHPYVFYGDDNARLTLGLIGASAYMNTGKWDQQIIENILANFRTTGKHGFRGDRLEEKDILHNGWKYYWNRDLESPHPHFESWMWACYLWLYDKTKYAPLLEKTKEAIRITMEAYPDHWKWTNGIQQERARMILPLAWLVRVEDTPEHRKWLDMVVNKLLENQVASGAIREELGSGKGMFGKTPSNSAYGRDEAPLIFDNGDPVADMLYTSNFAFFALNEAAQATGDPRYKEAVEKLSGFLTRIQVKSKRYEDVDGAWFRAFDYKRWDYWASNADAGWGAWSTLTGWIQSWIVATQVLTEQKKSYWDLTKGSGINKYTNSSLGIMFGEK